MRAEDVWYGSGPAPSLIRAALTPLSWLYTVGWSVYESLYRIGIKKASEPHRPVICVGNLTAGGSGKTPLVAMLARGIPARLGRPVVIGCSGYGSPRAEAATLAPEGSLSAREWGDEAALLRELVPGTPLVVGRRRVLAAEIARQAHPDAVLLMDDGLQHLPIRKHATLALDPDRGNGRTFPAGPYREPRSHRRRADLLFPDQFQLRLQTTVPGSPSEGQALCAIGDPSRFRRDLENLRIRLSAFRALPDHDPLDRADLLEGLDPKLPLIVTAKDWVKLRERSDIGTWDVRVAGQGCRVEPDAEFWARLAALLDAQT